MAMVLAYHGGVAGLSVAGYYGVDMFFVLSGFLITSLLLQEHRSAGRIDIVAFWGRRARRLLPALVVVLAVVALYVHFAAPAGRYPGFGIDALSALAYVSNWHFIASSSNYFAAAATPSLLTHTWSLAIEEQFYLVWPLVLWAAGRMSRAVGRDPNGAVLLISACAAVGSAVWMALLYHSGADPSRLYYGTDTHAQSILVGAALAAAIDRWPLARARSRWSAWTSVAALGALVWAACTIGPSDPAGYQGGFFLVATLAAVLIASLSASSQTTVSRVLSSAPLVYLGRISYGMYLWYFPLFEIIDGSSTGLSGAPLLAVRTLADVALASASFHFLETPLRRLRRRRIGLRPVAVVGRLTAVASVATAAALALTAAPAVSSPRPGGTGLVPTATVRSGAHPLRLLVTGDSTAVTLALALSAAGPRYGLIVDNAGQLGCGVAISAEVDSHGHPSVTPPPCNPRTPADEQWPALLQRQVSAFRPDLVLVAAGRWEVQSRRSAPTSPWTDLNQASDRAYVQRQLHLAAVIAASEGARVALATAPCFSSGEQPDGSPWPEDSPTRLRAYNALVRTVAAQLLPPATVVDLDSMVCPSGRFVTAIDGTVVRAPDGVHYPFFSFSRPASHDPDTEQQTEAFGSWITPRVLAALGGFAAGPAPASPAAASQHLSAKP